MDSNESLREPRFRINVSQSTKGIHSFDCTVEMSKMRQNISDPKDIGYTTEKSIGEILLEMLKETEKAFRKDGRLLAGDKTE